MSLGDQFKTLNGSAMLKTVLMAYAAGLCLPIGTMVLPHFASTPFTGHYIDDAVAFYRDCLSNPAWEYLFAKASLDSAISFTIGALLKTNAFDKFKAYFPTQTPTTINPGPKLQDQIDK